VRRRDDERSRATVSRQSVHRTDRSRGARLRGARTAGILADASPAPLRRALRSPTMKRTPTTLRIASALTLAALAACGGGGSDSPTSTTTTGTTTAPPAAAPAPAPAAAPAPASSGYPAGNAVRGKAIYSDLPNTMLSCEGCHGPAQFSPTALRAANNPELIARAISNNAGGAMRQLAFPVLNGQDLADIAAFLVTPGI
jgi:hypothetical protein